MHRELRAGDIVEIRQAKEILGSLDSSGSLDGLPFMPEMIELCGKRYRIHQRAVQVTMDGLGIPMNREPRVREFRNNDVVLLEGLRCSGLAHGSCQRGCMIFWKEAWVRKVEEDQNRLAMVTEGADELKSMLKTFLEPGHYFCQSSEIHRATVPLSVPQRIRKCFSTVFCGNCGSMEMLTRLFVWSKWKARQKLLGPYPRGNRQPTPTERLNLQPGEMVEIKTLPEIVDTLDKNGMNRGLHFTTDMLVLCGRQFRVMYRTERLIIEATGQMRGLSNTVVLDGVTHDGSFYAFGGCPRMDFQYWREIWLKRV